MLSVTEGDELSATELNRAISQAVADLSRYFPRELVYETIFELDVADETFAAALNTAVALAHKPIRFHSETVTNAAGTTTYTRYTDYDVDYAGGTITALSSGSMVDKAAHLITYQMDYTMIDISALTTPIAVILTEVSVGTIPLKYAETYLHGDLLTIKLPGSTESQTRLHDEDHIRIFYLATHTDPTDIAAGSFPRHLDEVVTLGAAGYALMIEAMQHQHDSVHDLSDARYALSSAHGHESTIVTALGSANTALTAVATALALMHGSAGKPLDDAITALNEVNSASGPLKDADTALDNVATYLDSMGDSAYDALTDMDTPAAAIATTAAKMEEPLDEAKVALDALDGAAGPLYDADAALDKVATHVTEADAPLDELRTTYDEVRVELDRIPAQLAAVLTALTELMEEVGTGASSNTRNADAYLDAGDATLNQLNRGGRTTPDQYRAYAETKLAMSRTYSDEAAARVAYIQSCLGNASQRLGLLSILADEAGARLAMAQTFIAEAAQRNATAQGYVAEASSRVSIAQGYALEAQGYGEQANAFATQATGWVSLVQGFINEAAVRVEMVRVFIEEANARVSVAYGYSQEAAGYQQQAAGYCEVVDRYLAMWNSFVMQAQGYQLNAERLRESAELYRREAASRLDEFHTILKAHQELSSNRSLVSTRQYS